MEIINAFNYPNPFSRDTYFTFYLTGSEPPEELSIRIFTVAGRRIREIILPRGTVQPGLNKIHWDGRDADGDELANGYYFYQVMVRGNGKTETTIQKLAKIR
jgi:flagellar hook assembly protein FlgD